ncbi:MAG: Na+/H+ antiporter NhaC family protein [Sutterella sp.]|nr:Na+/H+ antiporter NhaC family protein [Sutterella sp.]
MQNNTQEHTVSPWQAMLMLAVGVFIIFFGLMGLGVNARIVLAVDGVVMCLMACLFGIPYDALQKGIKDTIASMLIAMLILLAVGVLISSWMAAGTIPVMIYYGMQVITPALFLPVACILCTLMSTFAGTSWGTLATVGVACMGVAEGLGVPLEAAAGAICVGAFFGDKMSPLSDSTVITATVTDTPLMEGIRHALISTGPAYIISLMFFFIYGLNFGSGTVESAAYSEILQTIAKTFSLNPITLLPVAVVIALICWKKPTLPTFVAGIAVAAVLAMLLQDVSLKSTLTYMYSGYSGHSGSALVDNMLNRGGFTSMLSTIGLLMAAAMFGAPLRTAGVAQVLLDLVKKAARNSRIMSFLVMCLHAVFFTITGAYYVSYPVIGAMTKDMFPEYRLQRKNLMRMMLDTGTGLAPLVPWSTTGSYTASTLGVANMAFLPFAPMLWLSILFSVFYALTGIGMAKLREPADESAKPQAA